MTPILFLAHFFPPIGGAGVQRAVKFIRYLPEFGFRPLVLTGGGESQGRWAPEDASLLEEIPPEVKIYRITSRSDATRRRAALMALGNDIIRQQRPELIFVTMSPFDHASIAADLAKRHRIPWIADLRDPWALDEIQEYRTRWHRQAERRRMARRLHTAAAIIMNTPEARRRMAACFPTLRPRLSRPITNGYDAADFRGESEQPGKQHFTIVHTGYLHAADGLRRRRRRFLNRLLGRTQPGVDVLARSHHYLLRALATWMWTDSLVIERVRLRLLGVLSPEDHRLIRHSEAGCLVDTVGYVSHAESVREIRKANLLFLPMHRMSRRERATIVPGKTYEYLASGRPILAAVPAGDARDFLKQAGTGFCCEPDDVDGMLNILRGQFRAWQARSDNYSWNEEYIRQFERRSLTERLATELRAYCPLQGTREEATCEAQAA